MKIFLLIGTVCLLTACTTSIDSSNPAGTPITSFTATPSPSATNLPIARLIDLNTSAAITTKELLGKPYIINFWASWCTTCRTEYPILANNQLNRHIIGINVQDARINKQQQREAASVMRREGITIPNYVDVDEIFTKQLGIVGLPITLVVDENGQILHRHDGALTQELLMQFNEEVGNH